MEVFTSTSELVRHLDARRAEGLTIGLVPTMGALHDGHLSLIARSLADNDLTVCSIFVNPVQFNNPDDLAKYPRTFESDRAMLETAGCSIIFAPPVEDIYPEPPVLKMRFGTLETVMEGASRPGHFNGVGIVVSKLFNIARPHRAYFGQKDLQQVAVIQRMVTDLSFQLELVTAPTLREEDGLAMSSRNVRLSDTERAQAPFIYETLRFAQEAISKGQSVASVLSEVTVRYAARPEFGLDYFQVVNLGTLQPVQEIQQAGQTAICVAAHLGPVRLIDNVVF